MFKKLSDKRSMAEKRSECQNEGDGCRSSLAYKTCCGELVCYWPDGVSILTVGITSYMYCILKHMIIYDCKFPDIFKWITETI